MKIICISNNYSAHTSVHVPIFTIKPDTALLRNNNAFYYPDFSKNIIAELGLFVRIDRVGRSIAEKFATRYYAEIGLAIDFTAADLLHKNQLGGLPWETAKAFDYSFALSTHVVKSDEFNDIGKIPFSLSVNCRKLDHKADLMNFSVEQIIAHISNYMTIKIGDLIYLGSPFEPYKINIGDKVQAYLGEKNMLDFEIK